MQQCYTKYHQRHWVNLIFFLLLEPLYLEADGVLCKHSLAELHQREQQWGRLCPVPGTHSQAQGLMCCAGQPVGAGSRAPGQLWCTERVVWQARCALPGVILLYKIGLLVTFSVSLLPRVKIVHNCGVRSPGAQRSELRGSTNERLELMFWATTHRNQQTNIKPVPPVVFFRSTSDAPIHENSLLCSARIVNSQDTEY